MRQARYLRLANKIHETIQKGQLVPGSKLPTHRAFAEKFGVALATATRVYRELERRGVVVGEAGRGTFVRDPELPLSLGMRQTSTDELIDLVFNMPEGEGDTNLLRSGLRRLVGTGDLETMLRYQPHGGRPHERQIFADFVSDNLCSVDPENLLITSGGQHGLAIIGLGLLCHGDAVAVDTLTYPGFKSVAALQGLDLTPIKDNGEGMDPEDLERQCQFRKVRAVYLMPTVHNPLGYVMSEAKRRHLIYVARRHDLLLIEDGAYAFLETAPPPSLLELAPERTIYVGGISKNLATGLRLGYVIAPKAHIDPLIEAIRATTWNAPALISNLVIGWIQDGSLQCSEERRRHDGAERQRICREVFRDFPIQSHRNAGFAWLPLGQSCRAEPIILKLKELGISISGAEPFATTSAVPQALRLAFGGVPKHDLVDVMMTVRHAIEETCGKI